MTTAVIWSLNSGSDDTTSTWPPAKLVPHRASLFVSTALDRLLLTCLQEGGTRGVSVLTTLHTGLCLWQECCCNMLLQRRCQQGAVVCLCVCLCVCNCKLSKRVHQKTVCNSHTSAFEHGQNPTTAWSGSPYKHTANQVMQSTHLIAALQSSIWRRADSQWRGSPADTAQDVMSGQSQHWQPGSQTHSPPCTALTCCCVLYC